MSLYDNDEKMEIREQKFLSFLFPLKSKITLIYILIQWLIGSFLAYYLGGKIFDLIGSAFLIVSAFNIGRYIELKLYNNINPLFKYLIIFLSYMAMQFIGLQIF